MFSDGIKRQHWEVMGQKRLCLKTLMKGYVRKDYVQKDWWKYVIKDYLYIIVVFDFCWFLIVTKESIKWVVFSFFPNLIYLPRHTLDRKELAQIPTKGQKVVNWYKNGGFSRRF